MIPLHTTRHCCTTLSARTRGDVPKADPTLPGPCVSVVDRCVDLFVGLACAARSVVEDGFLSSARDPLVELEGERS
jgi:hypothetical protein